MEYKDLPVRKRPWPGSLLRRVMPMRRRMQTPATITVIEESRYQVALGSETRMVDNSLSSSYTTRKVRLAKEWRRTYTIDVERTIVVRGSIGLGTRVPDLKIEAERALSKEYSASIEERETFEEEVTLNIAAHTKSKIVFSWNEIRLKGVVDIVADEYETQIPFEVVTGLTFDQQQIDVSNVQPR